MSSAIHIRGEFNNKDVLDFFKRNKIEYSPNIVGGKTYYKDEVEVAWPDEIYDGISFSTYYDGDLKSVAKIANRFHKKFGGKLSCDPMFSWAGYYDNSSVIGED